jgi:O-antigen/teichoic acid export membrane protein
MSIKKSVETYRKNYDAAILFAMPLLLSILLVIIYPYPTFTSLGGIFLRMVTIEDLGIFGIAMTVAILLGSILLLGTTISAISLIVKEERVNHKIRYSLFIEAIKDYTITISVFYLLLFLLLEGIQLAVFMLGVDSIVYSLLSLAISYALFFAPFAMVIDDYPIPRGIAAGIDHLKTKPLDPLKWFVGIMAINLVVMAVFGLFMDYYIAKILTAIVNGLVLLPFMIVYGAHMYVDKYPMTKG